MTDLRIFDPTKVRRLFEEKEMIIEELRAVIVELRKKLDEYQQEERVEEECTTNWKPGLEINGDDI